MVNNHRSIRMQNSGDDVRPDSDLILSDKAHKRAPDSDSLAASLPNLPYILRVHCSVRSSSKMASPLDHSKEVESAHHVADFKTSADHEELQLMGATSPGVRRMEAISAHLTLFDRIFLFVGVFSIAYAYSLDATVRYTFQVSNSPHTLHRYSHLFSEDDCHSVIRPPQSSGISQCRPQRHRCRWTAHRVQDRRRLRSCRARSLLHILLRSWDHHRSSLK